MHGDILDANSTNKLIDQSVKDAIDNSTEIGNNTYYYNYNITSEQKTNQDGEEETIYNFIQVQLTGVPNYKDCVKNIIREYVSQTEEFDLINSYNKIQITGEKNSEDMKKYTDYISLLDKIKTNVKRDFNI